MSIDHDIPAEAQQHLGQMADTAGAQAQSVANTAREQLSSLSDDVRQRAGTVLQGAQQDLQTHAQGQTEKAAAALHDLARQLRSMTEHGEQGGVVDLTRQAEQRVERFAGHLDDGGAQAVLTDLKRAGQRRPGMFLLGAAVAGFAAGRLLRNVDRSALRPSSGSGPSGPSAPETPSFGGAPAMPLATGMPPPSPEQPSSAPGAGVAPQGVPPTGIPSGEVPGPMFPGER